jgi:hypothetical protein
LCDDVMECVMCCKLIGRNVRICSCDVSHLLLVTLA